MIGATRDLDSWRSALVDSETTIKEALLIINDSSLRIALVVDESTRLLGVVTDGDVRRAILSGLELDEPVFKIMNTDPLIADTGTPHEELIRIMRDQDVLSIPLLSNGIITGLATIYDELEQNRIDNPVFLMAGGFGTRLRPLTDHCPKPLLKVGEKPILEIILESFIVAGFHRFYISTHYKADMIRNHFGDGSKWGVEIKYIHEEEPLGTGGALGLLPKEEIDLPLFVMNGDVLTSLDFKGVLDFHLKNKSFATLCVREFEYRIPYGVIEHKGHAITAMTEKPVNRFFINAGVYLLSEEIVHSVDEGTRIDMPSLIEKYIENSQTVNMFPIHEYWLDIGRKDDFEKAQMDIRGLMSV